MSYDFDKYKKLPKKEKMTHLMRNEKIFHVVFAEQFDKESIEMLCTLATRLRKIAKSVEGMGFMRSLLSHKSAMLYFTQPSTRTYLSFVRACQHLGIVYADVRDPRISSAFKGETDLDGVKTFSSYFDLIIMRHVEAGLAEETSFMMNTANRTLPVISAGAGADEHPTQALLDIYTLHRSFEERKDGINGIHIACVGDVARGRTVRSLSQLLSLYDDIKITYVAPESLKIRDDLRSFLERKHVCYDEVDNLQAVIPKVDAVYMTRVQDEYDTAGESKNIDYSPFHLTLEDVGRMKESAIIMHPLPRRKELDVRIDDNPRAMYWRQERNGMWIRAALMAYIFNMEGRILEYYTKHHAY